MKHIPTIIALLVAMAPCRADIRVSFLQDTNILADTVRELRLAGCDQDAMDLFQRAVLQHNRNGIGINLSRFRPSENGFFTFSTCTALAQALPSRLWEAKHDDGLTCFDLLIALFRDEGLSCDIQIDDVKRGFIVPYRPEKDGGIQPLRVATSSEAFATARPTGYTSAMTELLGLKWTDEHKALTICLTEYHKFQLIGRSSPEFSAKFIMGRRLAAWRSRGLKFPKGVQVVQLHVANLSKSSVVTYHCGLLIPRQEGGFMYLEKADLRGPFLRIDLNNPEELLSLADLYFLPPRGDDNLLMFASANEKVLGVIDPSRAFSGRSVKGHEMWRMSTINSWDNPVTMHSPDGYFDYTERKESTPSLTSDSQTDRPKGKH